MLSSVEIPALPFQDMKLVDVLESVLSKAEKPMTQTEMVVSMLESGYETEQEPSYLRNHVGTTMRNDERFKKTTSGRWCLC